MKTFLYVTLSLLTYSIHRQDTTYYNSNSVKTSSMDSVYFYTVIQHDIHNSNNIIEKSYFKSGQLKSEYYYPDHTEYKTYEGTCKEYYESGQLRKQVTYLNGEYNGEFITYRSNGMRKRLDNYKEGKLLKGTCYNAQGKDTTYYAYEMLPAFNRGGDKELTKYFGKNFIIPEASHGEHFEGIIYVVFVIDREGYVTQVSTIKSPDNKQSAEAMRVIREMPRWQPGRVDGEAVSVKKMLPIKFTIH